VTERPLLTRQLDGLGDWLAKSSWTIRDAACLLAGFLPSQQRDDPNDFGAWLPGRKPWEVGREAWHQLVTAEIAHIEAVLIDDKRVLDHTPGAFIILAVRLRIVPPWAKDFLGSRRHSVAVSGKVRSALREVLGEAQETNSAANRSFGARADNWDEAVLRAVELRSKGKSPDKIADALSAEGFCWDCKKTKPFGAAAIRRWFREMKGDPENGSPPKTALEYTEQFREWRDRVKR
jgi:hypothetical protein